MAESEKPVLIYDGKCGFCKIWIEYWKVLTGDSVSYAASQDVGPDYPQIPAEEFGRSVQLVFPTGEVVRGARAVFETLALTPGRALALWLYMHLPGFGTVTETAYAVIAANRNFFYRATVLLFGKQVLPLRYDTVAWLFRKWLAVAWFAAFVSFGVQSAALIGSNGVLPAAQYLDRVRGYLGGGAFAAAPSLLWVSASDAAIQTVWVAGAVCSVLAFSGVFWRAGLFLCFVLYLSLLNTSQEFLSFQWDILLLETGFLALFLNYSRAIVWMFRWLLFRLMFLSGAVKLLSGDATWRNGTALLVHFETQPIPTPLAWYAHQLPAWFLMFSSRMVIFVELAVPLLILAPRRLRRMAALWLIGLQVLILLTGNYAFFNWLSIGLCLFLFDDESLGRVVPGAWIARASRATRQYIPVQVQSKVGISMAVLIAVLSTLFFVQTLHVGIPSAARTLISNAAPFGITSTYGLFATMTTARPEIILEGTRDGVEWREYEFRYKPGRLDRRPPWVAPHQPRLDWQMWFAALGTWRENVWLVNLVARLLQGDAVVLAQLEGNPFPDGPPKAIRARLYDYRFSDFETRRRTGDWWIRKPAGLYLPAVTIQDLSELPLLRSAAPVR